ncbi:MAG: hypothetical protein GY851_12275, partial [bacterium]|nr:hypothetical protein [bacterium]
TQDSPLVDAGSDAAARLGFDAYTTRLDGQDDAGQVDIGFHYPGQGRYQLLVSVIGGHGTVTPMSGYYHEFAEVALTATPDAGYRVREWIGTDDDPGWSQNAIVVTMDTGDKFVMIEFEENKTRSILVPQEFNTVEEAVQAASPGDTHIILSAGVHYVSNPDGIDLQQKAVRIMSTDPNDPNTVAGTIIDCGGGKFTPKRAFHFQRGEGSETLITGVTIRNAYWIGGVGITGGVPGYFVPQGDNEVDPESDAFQQASGTDASGIAYGGAILCENGSSPTFRNCVIEDCGVVAAQGGDGINGFGIYSEDSDEPGQWGGHGGSGQGDSFGGALACLSGSKPTLINCTIRNCFARGGLGGDGGNGSNPNDGSGWESNGGDAGDAIGDGHGGPVYCADGSDAIFQDCVFENNEATNGFTGTPGSAGPGGDLPDDYGGAAFPGFTGQTISFGTIVGGAVHQDNANPTFENCRFVENEAYALIPLVTFFGLYEDEESELPVYTRGGAIYAAPGSAISLDGCEFSRNISSAIYAEHNNAIDFNDCVFSLNEANGDNVDAVAFRSTVIMTDDGGFEVVPTFDVSGLPTDYAGGALFVGPDCPEVLLRDCAFYSNIATGGGGAVRLMSDAEFIDCSFSGNKAGEDGGALEALLDSGDPENPIVLQVNLERCSFGGNTAIQGFYGMGGGVHLEDFEATITDCYFLGNRAKSGGGLFLTAGTVELAGGSISGNTSLGGSGVDTQLDLQTSSAAINFSDVGLSGELDVLYFHRGSFQREEPEQGVDVGGGLVLAASNATIEDCMFTGNNAGGLQGSGGAISFYGGYVDHRVRNCLFLDNQANREGGAIWAGLYAAPVIEQSTFGKNSAERLGGAIACDWDSDVTVRDSIFTENVNLAISELDFGNSDVTHSLFYANPDGDYGVFDSASKETVTLPGAELDATNIDADPLFVEGPLGRVYLSQAEAGQDSNSPAVDAGSDLAENVSLASLTTRTDGIPDIGVADLGFHFSDHTDMPKFTLTAEVVGGHGAISPMQGEFFIGTSVAVTATPESGWRIAQWTGTTDDASSKTENLVVIGADQHVTVAFDQPKTIVVGSHPGATTIQHAIDLAEDGDTVL